MKNSVAMLAASALTAGLVAASSAGLAAYSASDASAMLHHQGYRDVRISDDDRPGFDALACKGKAQYHFEISDHGKILSRERAGRCGERAGVHVRAPFVAVDVDRGVRVRAPFVDIWIPRNGRRD